MTIIHEERPSDAPYVEKVMRGWAVSDGSPTRPAEIHWHMVFSKRNGHVYPLVVGPWSQSGTVTYGAGGEILWIKFKLGVFMPHLPTRTFLDSETPLPGAAGQSFWLKGSAWALPDYENADTFVDRLVRADVLVCEPLVSAALQDQPLSISPRTVRHRFLRATGLTQSAVRQMQRAQQAAALLREGTPILDVVFQLGYFDQPHLTRSLKQFTGCTPAQLLRLSSFAV